MSLILLYLEDYCLPQKPEDLLLKSVKISMLPPKYEIIMVPSNHSFFQYCDSDSDKRLRATTFDIAKLEEQ